MFVKKIGALLTLLLLFSASNADAEVFAVGCQVTFKVKPACEAQGRMTYNPFNNRDPVGRDGKQTSAWDIELLGIGDSFAEAWDDVHGICEKRACHVTSCTLKQEKSSIGDVRSAMNFGCQCSYKVGNTCGGRFGNTGRVALQGGISQFLGQADQICEQKLRETSNVPAQAVAFAHDCGALSVSTSGGTSGNAHIRP